MFLYDRQEQLIEFYLWFNRYKNYKLLQLLSSYFFYLNERIIFYCFIVQIVITVVMFTIILVTIFLVLVQFFLSCNSLTSEPQLTVLESGFESLKSRVLLRSSFFIMVALFVLFDLELILLFPAILVHTATSLNWVAV